jgi:hypothetical protein
MAFLQTGFPPSTAPLNVRPVARARRPMPFAKAAPRKAFGPARIAGLGALLAAIILPGYTTLLATESFALAFLAADFAFLVGVAAWSTVSAR